MTEEEMRTIILSFPDVEEGRSYGRPSFKVRGRFLTRLREEDDSLVLTETPADERDMLIAAEPETFHTTAHYRGYPIVLARIQTLDPGSLRLFLERRWKKIATRAAVRAYEAERAPASPEP